MATQSFFRRPVVLLALALASVGGVVTLMGRLAGGPRLEAKRVALSSDAGSKSYPAFSPDGQRIAYSARGSSKVDPYHVYVRTVAPDTPRAVTGGTGNDIGPVWSPDGKSIAYTRLENGRAEYRVALVDGGDDRKIAEFPNPSGDAQPAPGISWAGGGKSLVVVMMAEKGPSVLGVVPLEGGTVSPITKPAEGDEGDTTPVVSPDGQTVAFVRASAEGADLYVCDLRGGSLNRVTYDDKTIRGVSWTADGSEVVYSANRFGGGWKLWRLAVGGGGPRELILAGRQAQFPAVAAQGSRVAYSDTPTVSAVWRGTIGKEALTDERAVLRSSGRESSPMYSPDGNKIVDISDQSGNDQIWISDADGGNRVQATKLEEQRPSRPRWSPDSKQLVFELDGGRGPEILTMVAAAGAKPSRVATSGNAPVWSSDGKKIYYRNRGQLWKVAANGSKPEALIANYGGGAPLESADGKFVYYSFRRSIWRVPVAGGEPEEAIIPERDSFWGSPVLTVKGVYYPEFERSSRTALVSFYDFATRKRSVAFRFKAGEGSFMMQSFSISPDGKYVLFPKVDQSETNLMMLENFK